MSARPASEAVSMPQAGQVAAVGLASAGFAALPEECALPLVPFCEITRAASVPLNLGSAGIPGGVGRADARVGQLFLVNPSYG
jgi:hypothetical protein